MSRPYVASSGNKGRKSQSVMLVGVEVLEESTRGCVRLDGFSTAKAPVDRPAGGRRAAEQVHHSVNLCAT